jgi:uroporphyrinogen-III synthase
MRPLVIVRPEPGASATARAAEAKGLMPVLLSLFKVEPVEWEAPDAGQFDALLLTSANAIRHGGNGLEGLRQLRAYCVGEATATAAREAGLSVIAAGTVGVDELLQRVPRESRLLHLSGTHWREPANRTHAIRHLPVYDSVELPPPEWLALIEGAVVAVHSPRAASTLARHADDLRLDRHGTAIAAISAETAAAAGKGWETVEPAAEPRDSALLAIATRLCHNRG